ncbi:hypothetical protein QR680_000564 [Steinernema hermaphroditum]|uniref:Uncharacterized protein n=1 Tax=Steinernema hermaphroditum TaxID=289476 RepID=A0AA39GV82_9BILA|nr:hypothetical protein QR680_000564 [Steinernema hermaphroditum]
MMECRLLESYTQPRGKAHPEFAHSYRAVSTAGILLFKQYCRPRENRIPTYGSSVKLIAVTQLLGSCFSNISLKSHEDSHRHSGTSTPRNLSHRSALCKTLSMGSTTTVGRRSTFVDRFTTRCVMWIEKDVYHSVYDSEATFDASLVQNFT